MPKSPRIALSELFEDRARTDAGYAIAHAIMKLADAQDRTATHLKYLGTGDASTTMGAIENLAVQVAKAATAISEIARSLEYQSLDDQISN